MFKWEDWTNYEDEELPRRMRQALREIKFCPPLSCPIADECLYLYEKIETMLNEI